MNVASFSRISPFLLLRLGLAFVFVYAAYSSFLNPESWIGFFPNFIRAIVPENILLTGFSLVEIVLGVWLVSGFKTFYAAAVASLLLLGIVIFNLAIMDLIFRDIGLFFASLALLVGSYNNK